MYHFTTLGLPWLWSVNPEIDWEKGQLMVKEKHPARVTVEEIPDHEGAQIGGMRFVLFFSQNHLLQ